MTQPTVYEPNRRSLPSISGYVRRLWASRHLAVDLARTEVKAEHQNTVLGQVWQLLNPLLLALAYLFVFEVISGRASGMQFLAFLLAGLFVFYYTRNAVVRGANSVISGGALVTNTRLPRAVLPLSAVLVALFAFIPSVIVYLPFHFLADRPVGLALVALLPLMVLLTVFNTGLALLFGALNVYFRDVRTALPFVVRIWLYISPVLYAIDEVPDRLRPVIWFNPLSPYLQGVHDIVGNAAWPTVAEWALMVGWAAASIVIGGVVFIWREREFAVRL